MPSRDDVVRWSKLEAALGAAFRSLSISTAEDARPWVRFACQCVLHTPCEDGGTPLAAAAQPSFRTAFQLAERWCDGEALSLDDLREARAVACKDVETLTPRLTGAAAARWSVLHAVEAALHAAAATPESLRQTVEAVEGAARYARQAAGARSVEAAQYQKDLFDKTVAAR
jgi:hypothetical protein